MYSICLRMLRNKPDADDVLQNSFVIAFEKLSALRNKSSVFLWIREIVIHECIKHSKKKLKWTEIADENIPDTVDEDEAFDHIPVSLIEQETKNLADGYRQIFNLYAFENYSHKEIAQLLNISESTSKTQYHRAKAILRKQLKNLVKNG